MYLLGYDIGSSSVKASLVDAVSGKTVASDFYPRTEAEIISLRPGWAEQRPEQWWNCLKQATASVMASSGIDPKDIKAIGISYQMHGLVMVDKDLKPLRPAIIWCDSRGVPYCEVFLCVQSAFAGSIMLPSAPYCTGIVSYTTTTLKSMPSFGFAGTLSMPTRSPVAVPPPCNTES